MTKTCLCLLLHIIWAVTIQAQHKSHSLQTAVDALHRREAQLALRDYENAHASPDESGYIDNPGELEHMKQQELNKLLANYLGSDDDDREQSPYESEFDDEDYNGFDERKRSIFRERGIPESPYQSVFRERESDNRQPDLAAQFLKEIDRERNFEREEAYKENLRRLWEKYQQQENEIEEELFDDDKQSGYAPQAYWGPPPEKRRIVLPWLPATRRKRFPVAKRSSIYPKQDARVSGTNEKVARDLQAIFGESDVIDEKKKRSSGDLIPKTVSTTTTTVKPHKIDKKSDRSRDDDNVARQDQSQHYDDFQKDKPEDVHPTEDEEYHENNDHEHEREHEHDHEEDEEDDDFEDDDDDDKKKKRSTSDDKTKKKKKRANLEILKEDQIIPGDLTDIKAKKSVQWGKYWGLDRKKKSDDWFMNKYSQNTQPKQHFRHHDDITEPKPVSVNEEKLQNMNQKLKNIEDLIIDETVKYTGSHEGVSNPEEIQKLKDHVISRLATAYSLEKMRRALDKLKQSVDNERHLGQNESDEEKRKTDAEKEKRVAIKKEKVQFDNNHHTIEPQHEKVVHDVPNGSQELPEEDKKKKKKKNVIPAKSFPEYNDIAEFEEELGAGHFEPLTEGGYTNSLTPNQCPLILAMEKRCRGVDLLSGDMQQELLPVCGIHQICYLCGTSQSSCDFQYLNDADSICGYNKECQSAARSALMILRGSPGPLLGPRECAKNPCLHQVLRDIGLLI